MNQNKFIITGLILLFYMFCCNAQQPSLVVQTGHSLSINYICFSPNSQQIASCSDDNLIVLWDVATGKQIRSFVGHTKPVIQVKFHPNQNILASVSIDNTIKINISSIFQGHLHLLRLCPIMLLSTFITKGVIL